LPGSVARHGQAINSGKPEVGHDQVRRLSADRLDCLEARVGLEARVAEPPEEPLAVRDQIRFIVDDEDRPGHGRSTLARGGAIAVPGRLGLAR
jgi:hypothetical protein